MKSFAAIAALLAAIPFAMGQQMQVNSLTGVVECEPILISWTGGTPPYYFSFIPAGQPSAPAIKQFPPQQGTSYTWLVDLPAGTGFTTELKDSSGQAVYSGNQQVESGSGDSCANSSVMESGTAASGTGTTTPGAAAANPTTSATQPASATTTGTATGATTATIGASHAASSSHSSGTAASLAASGSSATPSATQNAAVRDSSVGLYGLTGLVGLLGAAFL